MPQEVAEFVRKPDSLSAISLLSLGWRYARDVSLSLKLAARRWVSDDASSMAAAVAYYLALSLFPMLLLLISGLGLFLKFTNLGHDAEVQILAVVAEHCSPSLETQIRSLVKSFVEQSMVSGPFGLATAIMAAIGVFYQFERAFDKIWRIPPPPKRSVFKAISRLITARLAAFLMLVCVGLAIVGIMLTNVAIGALREWMTTLRLPGTVAVVLVDATATLLMNSIAFGMLYRWLPKRKVLWRDALRSGLLVAIFWEVGRQFLSAFLIGMRYTTTYGAIGSFIAILLWFYWGVSMLFFGAEYLQVLSRKRTKPLTMFQARQEIDCEREGLQRNLHAPRRAA